MTSAFHKDGLADTSDALGAFDREKLLLIPNDIRNDSRIGTFGGCALVFSIGTRAALIARLGTDAWWAQALVGGAARVGLSEDEDASGMAQHFAVPDLIV